jgi:hypothetical protein
LLSEALDNPSTPEVQEALDDTRPGYRMRMSRRGWRRYELKPSAERKVRREAYLVLASPSCDWKKPDTSMTRANRHPDFGFNPGLSLKLNG